LKAVNRIIEDKKNVMASKNAPPPVSEAFEAYFFIQAEGGQVRIDFDTIQYVQSWGNYVKIFTQKDTHLATMTTQEAEARLPSQQFIRIHRSFLVATASITKVIGNQLFIGKNALPIGATYRQKVFEKIQ
jgi:DNA-binding LytR/AlgR family response regulator